MQGSTSAVFIRDYVRVLFEDTLDTYRPGMNFEGKANQKGGKKQPDSEARERERPFHSKGNSFLTLIYAPENPSSSNEITVMVKYTIDARALNLDKITLDFCYIVLSQSRMHQNGRLSESVSTRNGAVITGELRFTLNCQHTLVPFAHVVVFTVLPSKEPVTGSILIPIQNVLPEVSIVFSSSKVEPGETISFTMKAKPGSLCSVRALIRV
ncbi:alpha-2-macroglobulin-like protein 1 [Garra rufa]|uniref:alpha-2-macroglobulin-like protein 1 n=1 Tax=Garra rufa TaxID=137080 RepID=UPI003CCEB5CA